MSQDSDAYLSASLDCAAHPGRNLPLAMQPAIGQLWIDKNGIQFVVDDYAFNSVNCWGIIYYTGRQWVPIEYFLECKPAESMPVSFWQKVRRFFKA